MAVQSLDKYLNWLTARYYVYFEVGPTQDSRVEVLKIDKFGTPVASTRRIYKGDTLISAIKKAYEQELQKLAES